MNCAFKTMNCAFKTMNCAFKTMNQHAPRTAGHWYQATPLGVWNTKDEPMVLIAYQPNDFVTLCDVLGTQHWLGKDSTFRNSFLR